MKLQTLTLAGARGTVTLGALASGAGGHLSGYTIDDIEMDAAPLVTQTTPLPLAVGGLVPSGSLGVREIVVTGMVLGASRTAVNALRRQLVGAAAGDITVGFTPETSALELSGRIDGTIQFGDGGGHWLTYMVRIVCADPVAYATTDRSATINQVSPGNAVLTNGDGDVWPTVTVTVTSGTVTAVRVGTSTTGKFLNVSGISLGAGKTVVFTQTPGQEEVLVDGTPAFNKLSVASRFWTLIPGTNRVYRTVTGGTVTVSIGWRDGWVS
jgi:hypothetical protein